MVRGIRTRSQLLSAFVIAYVILAAIGGVVAWRLLDSHLVRQAEARARSVAELAGYLSSDIVRKRMEELTGYQIEIHPSEPMHQHGSVSVPDELGRFIQIDYRNQEYRNAQQGVVIATLSFVLAGLVLFAGVAWITARNLAKPLETLARSARGIGAGDFDQAVPLVGNGEIADLASDLEAMRARLQELDEASRRSERLTTLGTFTAVIAHEIRNPLSAVRLSIQMAEQGELDAETRGIIQNELDRLDLIVDELLAFSRGITIEPQACELSHELHAVARLLQRQAEHAEVEIHMEGTACCFIDPKRFRQLALNLMVNAIQAQHGGGHVTITVRNDGCWFRDHGPGVPPELLSQLFEPFVSGRSQGTGLGLHIAKVIAEAHGAELTYQSAEPGACFILSGLKAADKDDTALSTGTLS